MRARFSRLAPFAATAVLAGCNADGTAVPVPDASADGPSDAAPANDASPAREAAADAASSPGSVSYVRVANWSFGAPAIDVCLAPHGTNAFQGPLVAALAIAELDAGDYEAGGPPPVSFAEVSAYIPVSPGSYDARLVVAGALGCSPGLLDLPSIPGTVAGGFATIALLGNVSPGEGAPGTGLRLIGLDDVGLTADPGHVALRFVHAAPNSPTADMGIGSFTPLFADVSFGGAATVAEAKNADPVFGAAPIQVDDAGYVQLGSYPAILASAHATGTLSQVLATGEMFAAGGTIVTIVLLGGPPTSGDSGVSSDQILECVDNGPIVGPLSDCFVLASQ